MQIEKYTKKQLKDILNDLANKVYAATGAFEEHERYHGRGKGCLFGNGHHASQKAAQVICNMFVERLEPEYREWFEPDGWGGYTIKDMT